jgi:hypothetical protein
MSTKSENDPLPHDKRAADPNPVSDNRSGGDHAWEDELTEEGMPTPEQREDAAHEVTLDP